MEVSILDKDNILGKTFIYQSEITREETEFKAIKFYSAIHIVGDRVYSVGMIVSENGTHYNLEEDKILWK